MFGGAETLRATPRAPLTAPGNLDANTEGDRGVRLSWSDPADSTLTGYQHRYRNTSDDGWNPDWTNIPGSGAATTSHILTGMAKDLLHTLEVRTLRGTEQGPAASRLRDPPRGSALPAPTSQRPPTTQRATLSWDNPGDHSITGYQYRHQAATETGWNPNWTSIPSSNAGTTSPHGAATGQSHGLHLRGARYPRPRGRSGLKHRRHHAGRTRRRAQGTP